jgi:hypothetical protein
LAEDGKDLLVLGLLGGEHGDLVFHQYTLFSVCEETAGETAIDGIKNSPSN